ncbi:hypothetical protein GCM10009601_09760 [Streptomyces thermospinosisporus]|uniref:DUF2877 domain-containing protein n=1 Tax=Streptomyces thermospinosisporus TaxID=161482 RepID=A0ABN1YKV3_9ACTN
MPAADDAFRISATVRGPSIIAVPTVLHGRTVVELVWTDRWEWGTTALNEALNKVPHATLRLFGYRTKAPRPTVIARRLLSPSPSQLVNPLGQIQLSLPSKSSFRIGPHLTVIVDSAESTAPDDVTEEQSAAVVWSALACGVACEGPLHPRRIATRFATQSQRDIAGSFVGVLGSWLYLSTMADGAGPLMPMRHNFTDMHNTSTVTEVLVRWEQAAGHCLASDRDARISRVHSLLATGIGLLMKEGSDPFSEFTSWFRGQRLLAAQ